MAIKTKSRVQTQKKWDLCDANCSSCWPLVYQRCKSHKKVERTLIKLDDQVEREEEKDQDQEFIHKILDQGYILILAKS